MGWAGPHTGDHERPRENEHVGPGTLPPSLPRAGRVLPGELERRGGGRPPRPRSRRQDDLTAGRAGSWPSAASSRKRPAGPGLGISASAAGPGPEGRREKTRSRQEGGGSRLPGSQGSQFLCSPVPKGPEEADQEHSWQPGSSHTRLRGKFPEGNISFCTPGALGRERSGENQSAAFSDP